MSQTEDLLREGSERGYLAAMQKYGQQIAELREALTDYAAHQSWRCEYRTRYHECCCGLDETMARLGLEPVEVNDPEAKP